MSISNTYNIYVQITSTQPPVDPVSPVDEYTTTLLFYIQEVGSELDPTEEDARYSFTPTENFLV